MNRSVNKSFVLFLLLAALPRSTFLSPKQDVGPGPRAISLGPGAGRFGQALPGPSSLRQYTAGGHVLGFREGGVVIASGSHALRVEFLNARPVLPVDEGTPSVPGEGHGRAPELGKVTYRDLWDGVTAVFEKTKSGVVKSTYHVQTGVAKASLPIDEIRLRYNVPVRVDESGNLVLTLATGEMRETRPVAWQEIGGKRTSVEMGYRLLGGREVGFKAGAYDSRHDLVIDPVLIWITSMGADRYGYLYGWDYGYSIALDPSGNVYVTGYSDSTWGMPVNPKADYFDAFVAKLDGNGARQWSTFLGGTGNDYGLGIAVNTSGNVYVTGYSTETWGTPINPFAGGTDAFVAKLDGTGALQWNTFLGSSSGGDNGCGIALDASGDIYLTGDSEVTWGSPVRPFAGGTDAFVAKLDGTGALQWNTFLGEAPSVWPTVTANDCGYAIAVDVSGNSHVTGWSTATWGTPIRPFSAAWQDTFVAKLDGDGALQWNTFLDGSGIDFGPGIAVDTNGNSYVTSASNADWGSPVRPYTAYMDAYVAKLDASGALQWNTFLGGSDHDYGTGIAMDTSGNFYVTGNSYEGWGTPVSPHPGGYWDAFVAKLDGNGALQWNTFMEEWGQGIAVDTSRNAYVVGSIGDSDAFVAKIDNGIRVDFNRDGQEDILWRYYGQGGYNRAWFLGNSQQGGLPLLIGDSKMTAVGEGDRSVGRGSSSKVVRNPRGIRTVSDRPKRPSMQDACNIMGTSNRRSTASAMVDDPRKAGGIMPEPSRMTVADPRLVVLTFMPESSSKGVAVTASAPTWLGGADVMPVGDLDWHIVGTGDFNKDGDLDILWRNISNGSNVLWFMDGTAWAGSAELIPVADLSWQIVGTGDFNKDTYVDILWRNSASGTNVVWFMNGAEWIGSTVLLGVSDPSWQIVGTGYFNEDGNVDILWRYNGAGGFNVVWYMDGTAWSGSAELIPVGDIAWEIVGTGDYDRDGNVDILWRYNGAGGYNYIWYMDGVNWIGGGDLLPVADLTWRIVSR